MELLRGATLKEFLKQSDAAPLERKLDLMIQLCAGLGAAHNASIYHRDIKPGNIFVRADGILKILDFGVARLASSSMTAAGFIVGTPDYMSPEQARGADIDGRSDIFSLGGVFYFMLTGRKPFPATDLPTLFHQIQSDDPAASARSGGAARAGGGDHEGALEEAGDAVSELSGAPGRPEAADRQLYPAEETAAAPTASKTTDRPSGRRRARPRRRRRPDRREGAVRDRGDRRFSAGPERSTATRP